MIATTTTATTPTTSTSTTTSAISTSTGLSPELAEVVFASPGRVLGVLASGVRDPFCLTRPGHVNIGA